MPVSKSAIAETVRGIIIEAGALPSTCKSLAVAERLNTLCQQMIGFTNANGITNNVFKGGEMIAKRAYNELPVRMATPWVDLGELARWMAQDRRRTFADLSARISQIATAGLTAAAKDGSS